MEYTVGTNDIDYSYDNNKVKRYSNLKKAIKDPKKVVFLDIWLTNDRESEALAQELESNIFRFSNLKKLTVYGNHKSRLPENIFKITSLEFLAINSFNLDPNTKFDDLKRIKFLSLGDCRLTKIPESILNLTTLQGIDLTANEITYIPERISNLTELRTIDLTNNNFLEIPTQLAKCHKLQYIDLINSEGTNVDKLKSVNVGVNEVKVICDLNEFKSLKALYLTWAYPDIESLKLKYPNLKFK